MYNMPHFFRLFKFTVHQDEILQKENYTFIKLKRFFCTKTILHDRVKRKMREKKI